jgi:prephenate dehydrogenase
MAGREQSGYDAADPHLFEGATWVVTPTSNAQLDAYRPWLDAVQALGAHVEMMDAAAHDRAVAWISHLPFALSAALVRAAASAPEWPQAERLAASGFRDMARLAGGDPAMYAAILQTNAPALLEALNAFTKELERLVRTVRRPETAYDYFDAARGIRTDWLRERDGER